MLYVFRTLDRRAAPKAIALRPLVPVQNHELAVQQDRCLVTENLKLTADLRKEPQKIGAKARDQLRLALRITSEYPESVVFELEDPSGPP